MPAGTEKTHRLSREEARRIAVRAQLLDAHRPDDVLETVRHLTLLQLEPTSAVAPSADLVLWSRLGSAYDRQELRDALDEQRLVELRGNVRVPDDLALYRAEMAHWPGVGPLKPWQEDCRDWVETNGDFRRDLLDRLRSDGPLPTGDLRDSAVRPWRSSGWNNHKNVSIMLDFLVQRGEVAVAGREGQQRLWDLAERVYPDDPVVPAEEARRLRDERWLVAQGITRRRAASVPWEHVFGASGVAPAGEPAVVEGVRGTWRVDPTQLGQPFTGRAALLSPFDRLVFDRRRMEELFAFDYVLEMYKPAAKRRWGYYALPVLYDDRLVGKLDARADRDAGVLRIAALHQDEPFTPAMRSAVEAEVHDLARWLELDLQLPGETD